MIRAAAECFAVVYLTRRFGGDWTHFDRIGLRQAFLARMPDNCDPGRWAVAIVGRQEGKRYVSFPLALLASRVATKAEAVELASIANGLYSADMQLADAVPVYEARPYRSKDYLKRPARRRRRSG